METTLLMKGLYVLLWIAFGILLFCNMAIWASGLYCSLNNDRSQQFVLTMVALAALSVTCSLLVGAAFLLNIDMDVTLASIIVSMAFGIIFGGCVYMGQPFEAPKDAQPRDSEEPND